MDKESATDDIESILGPNEKVLILAEEKISHPDVNVDTFAVTNERIILGQPHEPGTKPEFTDIKYSEIEGVELARGRRKFTIKVNFRDGRDPVELGFPVTPLAEQAHGIIGASLDLFNKPEPENAEGPSNEDALQVTEETEKAPEEPATDEGAPQEEEGIEEVAVEEKVAPTKEEAPKRRATRKRPASAKKAKSIKKEAVQDVPPAPEPEEVQAADEMEQETANADEGAEVSETAEKEEVAEPPAASTGDGWIDINGKRYEYDVIVHTDGSVSKRDKSLSKAKKAKYGHTPLTGKEVKVLLKESPDVIIIGVGQTGALPITPKAKKLLEAVPCRIGLTPQALEWLAKDERRSVSLFHVTC